MECEINWKGLIKPFVSGIIKLQIKDLDLNKEVIILYWLFWFNLHIVIIKPVFFVQLQMTDAMDNLEHLLCLSGGDGQIFTMEGPLCMKSVQAMFGWDCSTNEMFFCVPWGGFVHTTSCCSPGGWSTTRTPPSTRSCTVGTCRQTFRCSLVLSLWWWMKKWSPCHGRSAQVWNQLLHSLESVRF